MSFGKYTCMDNVTLKYSVTVAVRIMTMVTSLQ